MDFPYNKGGYINRNKPIKKNNISILILTSSTGSGHDCRAKAFSSWIEKLYGNMAIVKISKPLEESGFIEKFGVGFYNFIQKYMPWFHHVYYHFIELYGFYNGKKVIYFGKKYKKLLSDFKPDVILSVHDCLNRGYFEAAKKILGQSTYCLTYCEEHSGGYGFSRHWVNSKYTDKFLARNKEVKVEAIKLGLPEEKIEICGSLLDPIFYKTYNSDKTRKELDLDTKVFTILIASGSVGANYYYKIINAILHFGNKIQIIVLCGKNKNIQHKLKHHFDGSTGVKIIFISFTDQIAQIMSSSDCIIARAGSIASEAVKVKCPLILNGIGGFMPQELPTLRYFLNHNAATKITSAKQISKIIESWIEDPKKLDESRESLIKADVSGDPTKIIKILLGFK